MKIHGLLFSSLIGAVASARSMTPMTCIAAARLLGRRTPGRLVLLDRPLFRFGALAMGVGELFGDKMKTALDRTVFLGLLARVSSAGIAGAFWRPAAASRLAQRRRRRPQSLSPISRWPAASAPSHSGLIEDALIVAAGVTIVALAILRKRGG